MEAGASRCRVYMDGNPVTGGIDERSDAAPTSLICWLLVLAVVICAESAWVLWLRDAWTVTLAVAASPLPHVSLAAAAHHMLGSMKKFRAPMLGVQEGTR
jgi:hypothetical protein